MRSSPFNQARFRARAARSVQRWCLFVASLASTQCARIMGLEDHELAPSAGASTGGASVAGTPSFSGGGSAFGGAGASAGSAHLGGEAGMPSGAAAGSSETVAGGQAGASVNACAAPTEDPPSAPSSVPRSCATRADGAGTNCGAGKNFDCCASLPVMGGADQCLSESGATLQDFVLDKFEVTIGRFKQFIAAPSAARLPKPGSGTHPNGANCLVTDTGWDSAWDRYLPSSNLVQDWAGQCGSSTWTQAATTQQGDWLPASCITWFEAQAFCIWDGGYLPSWSELSYAAKGGSNNWKYPWGTAPIDSAHAVYDAWSGDSARPVGSLPAGDGRWQHSDLAGNVWEWCSYNAFNGGADCSAAPCHCNSMTAEFPHGRAFGGSYGAQPEELTSTFFSTGEPAAGGFITLKPDQDWGDLSDVGFRCARAAVKTGTQ